MARAGGGFRGTALVLLCSTGMGCGLLGMFGKNRAASRSGSPDDAFHRLDRAEIAAKNDPARAAQAGWMRYLIASDPKGAARIFTDAAVLGAPGQRALALTGLAEIAEDRTETLQAARLWVQAMHEAPQDPLAELAALRLLDVEGESPAVDEVILAAAAKLPAPAGPRAARLVREAAARILGRRGEVEAEARAWRATGAVQHYRVGGPFAALRLFDLSKVLPLDGPIRATVKQNDRALDFPDGDVGLELEPLDGDIFYAASDLTLARGGDYLLWIEGASALEARLDGAVMLARSPYPAESPRSQTAAVRLTPGKHELLVRWSRAEGTRFRLLLARADGAESDVESAAPAELAGLRATSPCALGSACALPPAFKDPSDLRVHAFEIQEVDPGDPLAAWLRARSTIGDDRAAARIAVERAVLQSNSGAPALALRAQQLLHDPEIPDRIARARALADLAEATRKDSLFLRARLTASALERDSERFDDAAVDLDKGEAALRELAPKAELPPRLLVSRARLLEARGNGAAAQEKAAAALALDPGRCDALQLLQELARREGSLTDQDKLAQALLPCPSGLTLAAQHARERGNLARSEELLAKSAALRPAAPQRLEQLGELQGARKTFPAAIANLRAAAALTPRSAEPLRRLAGLLELSGDRKAAIAVRRTALRLSPGDLELREQAALDQGEKLLAGTDRDGLALEKASRHTPAPQGASAVRVLDYGAVQFFPDGGGVERVHTLVRVLDKKAIGKFGEAQIPAEAQVLHLRTLKPDGRVLEPESIPEKEGISLPGLEAGDAVEVDYLRGIAPRGPELPGQTLGAFFFRDDETPLTETTYEVVSPGPLEVDAHNFKLPEGALTQEGAGFRFRYTARDVLPLHAEPHQPAEQEIMPWVQLGSGASQKDLVRSVADWALLRARQTGSVEELARQAGGANPREKADHIWTAVSQAVRGRSQGTDFSAGAPHVLAAGRGNRLLLLKAALRAADVPSHIALVRSFGVDPGPYRFPRSELYSYAVLRIDLPEGPLWADPAYRLAPLGRLPAFLRDQPAFLLPEPGEEVQEVRTPKAGKDDQDGRMVTLDLELDAEGFATGKGRDEHRGFEAASLKDALEKMDRDQRKQAVESMVGRGLRGVTLETLTTENETALGGTAALVYALKVQLARRDGEELFLPSSPLPDRLSRRWAPKAERTLPLVFDAEEQVTVRASITLPSGKTLRAPPAPVALATPFGSYRWSARADQGKLIVEEQLSMPEQRIPPAEYPAFAAFLRAVDEAQSQELVVGPAAPAKP